jgi:glycosyltransferase involved in cell wall biosynthesis
MRVGIVTPAWNMAPWIGAAIRSVLAQTHVDWRMVVVDDGSTDGTPDVVWALSDERLTLLRQVHEGVAAARNRGLLALEPGCEAILFLDADDQLTPNALTRLVAGLRAAPHAVAAAGPCEIAGRLLRPPIGDLLEPLLHRNRFANGGHLLIRRAATVEVGPFCPRLAYGEDWDYMIRLAMIGRFAGVPGRAPLLHVAARPEGAYYRMATDPAVFTACLDVIFANPALLSRLGRTRLDALRSRAEAECDWVIGRELIRHGRRRAGLDWLQRSVCALPSARRLLLLTAAQALPLLPASLRGPFASYPARAEDPLLATSRCIASAQ